ncbi:MAG TPA: sulfatase-like hydrolase/transferase [Gemmatimonadales bacterium]|nr:sulfatase-like hydrolase/transferase [Gemmatimonadales bacterium]
MALAALVALLAGLSEAGIHLFRRHVVGTFTWTSHDVLWASPLSYAVFSILAAGAMLAFDRVGVVRLDLRRAATVLLAGWFMSALVLLANGRLHWAAVVLLGVGLARLAVAGLPDDPGWLGRLATRALPWGGAGWVAITTLVLGGGAWAERLALDRLPTAPGGAPNVLLIILDTVRAASMSLYGYRKPTTPELARWFADGVVFQRAMSTAPWTLPSHASFFTGRYPFELDVDWLVPLDDRYPTLAEVLAGRGYATGGFVANHYYTTRESGLARGFIHYDDYPRSAREIVRNSVPGQLLAQWRRSGRIRYDRERITERRGAAALNRRLLDWLDRQEGRPFFAFVNYFDAHRPYLAPAELKARFVDSVPLRGEYDAAIRSIDRELGALFAELERRGVLRNTLVIVASDHGELFGEHGMTGHGNSLYRPVLRVPLLLRLPGRVPGGVRVVARVTLRDLPATVLELTGAGATLPGRSLSRFWSARRHPTEALMAELSASPPDPDGGDGDAGAMWSIFADRYHYVLRADGAEELYDVRADSGESRNLASLAEHRATLDLMRSALHRLLEKEPADSVFRILADSSS